MREVIKKSDELIEVGGKEYPLWEIIREGGKLYCREVAIMAEIDGMKIPATLESDDWMRAGRLRQKGDEESLRELEKMEGPLFTYTEIDETDEA
ncbi:MAG TPA: hypothetical protein PLM30_05105 [Synergistales bacterium]|nr:hypothetical protein [Synergistales bacterium]